MTWLSFTNLLKRAKRQTTGLPRTSRRNNRSQKLRFRPRLEDLECRNLPSTLTVLNNADRGTGSLRDTIAAAQNGDVIVFDPTLAGQTIALTSGELAFNQSLQIEGPGADQLAISGSGAGRVFDLTGNGADVTIAGLTIAEGLAAQGGGIENAASNLTLSNDVLSGNEAVGLPGGTGEGGGVFNGSAATLQIRDSAFTANVAQGGVAAGANGDAGVAFGGGLFNVGVATVSDTTFSGNQAHGGDGGPLGVGGNGDGGAIINEGSLTVDDGKFVSNQAMGGNHGRLTQFPFIGAGAAAGIYNVADLTIRDSSFTDNLALGGAGYAGVRGGNGNGASILSSGFPGAQPASATISDCTFTINQAVGGAGGAGAAGGQGSAAGVLGDHGTVTIRDCTFINNQAMGGAGGTNGAGGAALGGALRVAGRDGNISMLVTDSTFTGNSALGGTAGSGAAGGLADGGAIANVQQFANNHIQTLTLRDSVVQDNEAIGGTGAIGGAARGGGISTEAGPTLTTGGISTTVDSCVVADNLAQGADGSAGDGGNAQGGGLFVDAHAVLTLTGSTVTGNEAMGGVGSTGFSIGKGQGGGIYIATGGNACADNATIIESNSASTSNDDIFGVLEIC
jgi:hypothetical protein